MNDHRDQLREAFETHENQTPDPAVVYARVQELAGKYKRRRWGAQAAGGAVLGAGLIAGGIALPGVLPAGPSTGGGTGIVAPAAAPASPLAPSGLPAPSEAVPSYSAEDRKAWDAYFSAGYDYDDAVKLARLWKSTDPIGEVKAEAGRRLLAGEDLPFRPDPGNVADAKDAARVDAFFTAGYSVDDAVQLAELWNKPDAYSAKIEGGKRLLAGKKLPIKPDPVHVETAQESKRTEAFFDKGYDYADAVKLAKLWKLDSPYQAKVEGGKRILAGDALPFRP